jgi:hypothetical protein
LVSLRRTKKAAFWRSVSASSRALLNTGLVPLRKKRQRGTACRRDSSVSKNSSWICTSVAMSAGESQSPSPLLMLLLLLLLLVLVLLEVP